MNKDIKLIAEAYNSVQNNSYIIDYDYVYDKPGGDEWFDLYQEVENEFIIARDFTEAVNQEAVAELILRNTSPMYSVKLNGLDPSVDGVYFYYIISDKNVLNQIATIVANSGNDELLPLASKIQNGMNNEFAMLQKAGDNFAADNDLGGNEVHFIEGRGNVKDFKKFLDQSVKLGFVRRG